MEINAATLAQRFIGLVKERPGNEDDALILGMLRVCVPSVQHDEVPWCSAFASFVALLLGLPRSRSLAARSWLAVGNNVPLEKAEVHENDVVVLARGVGAQPGPAILDAPGHVGFFVSLQEKTVTICGGNQSNAVTLASFSRVQVLGVRRLTA